MYNESKMYTCKQAFKGRNGCLLACTFHNYLSFPATMGKIPADGGIPEI